MSAAEAKVALRDGAELKYDLSGGMGAVKKNRHPRNAMTRQEEDARRCARWLTFTKSLLCFGFQHLAAAYMPMMSEERRGYALCFEKVMGYSIPSAVLTNIGKGPHEIYVSLRLSMCHIASSTFFGSTWMGPPVFLGTADSGQLNREIDFDYRDIVYFISRLTDPSCVGVVEFVVSKTTPGDSASGGGLEICKYGGGWTILNLFTKPLPSDISDITDDSHILSCSLWTGTPRDLIVSPSLNQQHHHEIPGCALYYKLYTHRKLLRAQKYIAENETVGRYDQVAGLLPKQVLLQSNRPQFISCIGDREIHDPHYGLRILPTNPRLVLPLCLKVANCQLFIPRRDAMERRMLESLHRYYPAVDRQDLLVLSRNLRVGLHNGHTIIGGKWKTLELVEEVSNRDILITKDAVISLDGYIPDPSMALVFLMEYKLGIPVEKSGHRDTKSIIAAATGRGGTNTGSQPLVSTMVLGAVAYMPCDGRRILLTNTTHHLDGTQGVGVELSLLRDEACSVLSPALILSDGRTMATLDDVVSGGPKDRLSYLSDLRQSGVFSPKERMEATSQEVAQLGFDLRALHPHRGELRDQDSIGQCLEEEDKDPLREPEPEPEAKSVSTTIAPEDKVKEHVFSKPAPPAVVQTREVSEPRDWDDRVSDSLVGSGVEGSALRLNPYFYRRETATPVANEDVYANPKEELPTMRGQSSLYVHSMTARLGHVKSANRGGTEVLDAISSPALTVASKTIIPLRSNEAFVRNLTRGAKSRLARHGVTDALHDSPYALQQAIGGPVSAPYGGTINGTDRRVMDLSLEANDPLSIHEITIQLAAYRPGAITPAMAGLGAHNNPGGTGVVGGSGTALLAAPRAVYASFQFFSCAPTRTEPLRLLPASDGAAHVLVRDGHDVASTGPGGNIVDNDTPLALRYVIDTSFISPHESTDFTTYLAQHTLYIDIWDADALLPLGTVGIPLRVLMRQGQASVRSALECDVISAETVAPTSGGVTSLVIADGGPVSGEVVGSLQIIVANHGRRGDGPWQRREGSSARNGPTVPIEGLNWRAHGVSPATNRDERRVSNRPKHTVRAKPLAELTPELSSALEDLRSGAPSSAAYRSLSTATRSAATVSTLSYDEIVTLFRRFSGPQRGTVQYAGALLRLLDLPSLAAALKKLRVAFRQFSDPSVFRAEISRFANFAQELSPESLEEALRTIFVRLRISSRPEERRLLVSKVFATCAQPRTVGGTAESNSTGVVTVTSFLSYCWEESDRQDWQGAQTRLRAAVQKATLEGHDVEIWLSELDSTGSNRLSTARFREFLRRLLPFGRLRESDLTLACRVFSREGRAVIAAAATNPSPAMENNDFDSAAWHGEDPISSREVAAALGLNYVGNLSASVRQTGEAMVRAGELSAKEVLSTLSRLSGETGESGFTLSIIETALLGWGVLRNGVSIDALRRLLRQQDKKKTGRLSLVAVWTMLGVPYSTNDLPRSASSKGSTSDSNSASVEELLRLLLRRAEENGVAVDRALRHFDTNGDGMISLSELSSGLESLSVFDSLNLPPGNGGAPAWKAQLPALLRRCGANSEDGLVSLPSLFKALGLKVAYAPNVTQRLTEILSRVTSKGDVTIAAVFGELDNDGDGRLSGEELLSGLKAVGVFEELTLDDANAVIRELVSPSAKNSSRSTNEAKATNSKDTDNPSVSRAQFVNYFTDRVAAATTRALKKATHMIADRFRAVLKSAEARGVTPAAVFHHADRDQSGSVTPAELGAALAALPYFKNLSANELDALAAYIDEDASGTISLAEFENFAAGHTSDDGRADKDSMDTPFSERVKRVFQASQAAGLDCEVAFGLADKNGDGSITLKEFSRLLTSLPSLTQFATKDAVDSLFKSLDYDGNGEVSLSEWSKFLYNGNVPQHRLSLVSDAKPNSKIAANDEKHGPSSDHKSMRDTTGDTQGEFEAELDIFRRHVRRIAEVDGSIRGLLAFLDDDEDGLIDRRRFISLLRREGVFSRVEESVVDRAFAPFVVQNGASLHVVPLLAFLEGRSTTNAHLPRHLTAGDLAERAAELAALTSHGDAVFDSDGRAVGDGDDIGDYVFSRDPETLAVERKLRSLGRSLARRGVDVEAIFASHDPRLTGAIPRTAFVSVLSELGCALLEEGKVLNSAIENGPDGDIRAMQRRQIRALHGHHTPNSLLVRDIPRLARRLFSGDEHTPGTHRTGDGEFRNHLESMSLIAWYRSGQKQALLQTVLRHSLAHTVRLFPRFGVCEFFEWPLTNPFGHEERFSLRIDDPELRLVTSLTEWTFLRQYVRPSAGELGPVPVESEMFDVSGEVVTVTLLPGETLFLPFALLSLTPATASTARLPSTTATVRRGSSTGAPSEEPLRIASVQVVSASHGHLVAVLQAEICPRPHLVHRTLRFHEYENAIAKRRISLVNLDDSPPFHAAQTANGQPTLGAFSQWHPQSQVFHSRYVHCVESVNNTPTTGAESASRVVVEWGANLVAAGANGASEAEGEGDGSLHMLIRYRCGEAPSVGSFFLLLFRDPYQAVLHECWQVVIHSRHRLDMTATVGSPSSADLVIRGDHRHTRRVSAFCAPTVGLQLSASPSAAFQLVAGAYNRVALQARPLLTGHRRALVNVVDVDSRELLAGWLVAVSASPPAVMRSYDVDMTIGEPGAGPGGVSRGVYKKILFRNPWDTSRRFLLASGDELLMRPRSVTVEVGPLGTAYLRLYFPGWPAGTPIGTTREVHLFLNDAAEGHNEECHLFRIRAISAE